MYTGKADRNQNPLVEEKRLAFVKAYLSYKTDAPSHVDYLLDRLREKDQLTKCLQDHFVRLTKDLDQCKEKGPKKKLHDSCIKTLCEIKELGNMKLDITKKIYQTIKKHVDEIEDKMKQLGIESTRAAKAKAETKKETSQALLGFRCLPQLPALTSGVRSSGTYRGTSFAGSSGTSFAGSSGTSFAGSSGTSFAGSSRTSFAGSSGTSFAGSSRTSFAGSSGTSFAGSSRTSFAGSSGTSFAGSSGTSFAGSSRTSFAGSSGTSFTGSNGTSLKYYKKTSKKFVPQEFSIGKGNTTPIQMPSASRESAPAPDFESKGAIPKTTIGKTRLKVQQGPSSIDPSSYSPDDEAVRYCHCNQQSYGEMIMCDNRLCPMQWFHFLCVGIESAPKGNWFCELCRKDESRSHLMKTLDEFDVALKKWDDKRKYKE